MQGKRSSILLYFDNFRRVAGLPDEQLGLLFRALMECGEAELDGRDGIAGCAERYPGMSEETRMAFAFMADNIRRDAAAYAEKCANYRQAARRRSAQRAQESPPPGPQDPLPRSDPGDLPADAPLEDDPIVPAPPAVRARLEELMRGMRMEE